MGDVDQTRSVDCLHIGCAYKMVNTNEDEMTPLN
jgi:hypothetical protein